MVAPLANGGRVAEPAPTSATEKASLEVLLDKVLEALLAEVALDETTLNEALLAPPSETLRALGLLRRRAGW